VFYNLLVCYLNYFKLHWNAKLTFNVIPVDLLTYCWTISFCEGYIQLAVANFPLLCFADIYCIVSDNYVELVVMLLYFCLVIGNSLKCQINFMNLQQMNQIIRNGCVTVFVKTWKTVFLIVTVYRRLVYWQCEHYFCIFIVETCTMLHHWLHLKVFVVFARHGCLH
jgi:hypothetical protein